MAYMADVSMSQDEVQLRVQAEKPGTMTDSKHETPAPKEKSKIEHIMSTQVKRISDSNEKSSGGVLEDNYDEMASLNESQPVIQSGELEESQIILKEVEIAKNTETESECTPANNMADCSTSSKGIQKQDSKLRMACIDEEKVEVSEMSSSVEVSQDLETPKFEEKGHMRSQNKLQMTTIAEVEQEELSMMLDSRIEQNTSQRKAIKMKS